MTAYRVYKETALPGSLTPHSIYLVAPAARPDYVELYVTGASASTVKRVIDHATVQAMIDSAIAAGSGGTVIVDTIAQRNSLTPQNAQTVLVIDASADPTVTTGAASYVWRASASTWIKIAEAESMDVVQTWAAIQGRPTSPVASIDDAVTKRHAHTNKTQIDKIGEDAQGNLTYGGALPHIGWDSAAW